MQEDGGALARPLRPGRRPSIRSNVAARAWSTPDHSACRTRRSDAGNASTHRVDSPKSLRVSRVSALCRHADGSRTFRSVACGQRRIAWPRPTNGTCAALGIHYRNPYCVCLEGTPLVAVRSRASEPMALPSRIPLYLYMSVTQEFVTGRIWCSWGNFFAEQP